MVEEEQFTEYDSKSNKTIRMVNISSANQMTDPSLVGIVGDENEFNQVNEDSCVGEQAPSVLIDTPRRTRVITETFPSDEVYLSPPEIRTCTRVVQGLAPVQCEEKL